MAHAEEINVFKIASTQLDIQQVRNWLDSINATEFEIPECATQADGLVGLAAKRCYKSFDVSLNPNLTQVRTDWVQFIDNILKSRHGSVLEHATSTFAIEGVTRVFTAEMNRHRAGVAISEGSLRYIRFDNIGYWKPMSIRPASDDTPEITKAKLATVEIFKHAFEQDEENYKQLCKVWDIDSPTKGFKDKKQLTSMFRRIVGMGVSTGVVYTFNMRSLRHIMATRSSPEAEEEIAFVTSWIGKIMLEQEDKLFGDFEQDEKGFWRPRYLKV